MTNLEYAKQGIITEDIQQAAKYDNVSPEWLCKEMAQGHIVIPKNKKRTFSAIGIGKGLTKKINANIGTSMDHYDIEEELEKLKTAVAYGTDSVMDLSTGGDLDKIRKAILKQCPVMLGTVPIYSLSAKLAMENKPIPGFSVDELFDSIEYQCEQGIDYITVHCGVTQKISEMLKNSNRCIKIVSRGGSILLKWMRRHHKENPLYEYFDRLLNIAYKYDVTLSLGDGLRPGAICDATDDVQIEELITLGKLGKRALERNVQVMIEGPGHIPLNEIEANVRLEKSLCQGMPFYVLGPLTTDIAPGYDHITGAIGGALSAYFGADFLCYVTPAEHLSLPTVEDVRQGVIASKIAAHSADIALGIKASMERDNIISKARNKLDWDTIYKTCLDPILAKQKRMNSEDFDTDVCTMCGKLCAIKGE
ncbi:MAG: phosphomethylpyrimidine synthase [Candidatus Cloacimonadota bacterium]|nr:MAG: phosphomethylpyrimidine synthase [Candidatus Cloacimonadota bacterium]